MARRALSAAIPNGRLDLLPDSTLAAIRAGQDVHAGSDTMLLSIADALELDLLIRANGKLRLSSSLSDSGFHLTERAVPKPWRPSPLFARVPPSRRSASSQSPCPPSGASYCTRKRCVVRYP